MPSIVTATKRPSRNHVKGNRKIRVLIKRTRTSTGTDIRRSHVPTRPVRLAVIVTIINRLNRPLNQVMIMVGRVSNRTARIAQLQLRVRRDDGSAGKSGENETTKNG